MRKTILRCSNVWGGHTRPIATNSGHWGTLEQNCFNVAMSAFGKGKWVNIANYIETR